MPSEDRTPEPTPRVLDVMCDPVRWRTYQLLLGLGPLRARQLADLLEISEAAMIRGLEQMQSVGFVHLTDDESGKPVRFRPWRAIRGGLRLSGLEGGSDQAAMARWMRVFVETQVTFLRDWAEQEGRWPVPWREAVLNYDYWATLTVDEISALAHDVHAVIESYVARARDREPPDGAQAIYIAANAFPIQNPGPADR